MARRLDVAERRDEILAATVELVCESGHQAVRVADVATRLSVSAGLIIYHFRTKEELLGAAFAYAAERDLTVARALFEREPDPVRRLLAIIEWYLPTEASSRSWRLWFDGWAASQFDPSLAQTVSGLDAAWRGILADALRDCAAADAARIDAADEAALTLAAHLNGLAVTNLMGVEAAGVERIAGWARDFAVRQFGLRFDSPER